VTDLLRRYTLASYLVALMFMVNPIVDAATNAWPWYLDSVQWRFGSAGILSGYFVSILFGLMMMSAIGVAKQHRITLYLVAITSGLLTLLLLGLSVSYVLDTFQVRPLVREEQVEMFRIGAVKTAFKIVAAVVVTLVMTIASIKAARDTTATAGSKRPG
jgi:hypothetical protein